MGLPLLDAQSERTALSRHSRRPTLDKRMDALTGSLAVTCLTPRSTGKAASLPESPGIPQMGPETHRKR